MISFPGMTRYQRENQGRPVTSFSGIIPFGAQRRVLESNAPRMTTMPLEPVSKVTTKQKRPDVMPLEPSNSKYTLPQY